MRSSYDSCLSRLLGHEGGYSNHPNDSGGPTKFGITIADYRKYIKPNATAADVQAMNVHEAKTIYRQQYWNAQRCDELPAGIDYVVFDYGVNSGLGRSTKLLKKLLGHPQNTTKILNEDVSGAGRVNAADFINEYCDNRLAFLKRARNRKTKKLLWPDFGKGWSRRVAEVRSHALKLAGSKPAEIPKPPKPASQSKTIWASILAGLATIAETFVNVLGDYRVWIAIIVLALLAYIIWERNGKPDIRGILR
jgi:lysozyme family protein